MNGRALRTYAATGVLAVAVTSCGDGKHATTVTVSQPPKQQAAHPQSSQPSGSQPTGQSEGSATGTVATVGGQAANGADTKGIATGEGSHDGERFRFVLTQLKRSGDTVQLGARVENLSDDENASIQISTAFWSGEYQRLTDGTDEGYDVFDGVALIDSQGRKKYLVARDSTGRCVCSKDLSAVFAYPQKPISLSATLSAPPPAVTHVDVVVPNVGTLTNVPITG